MKVAPDGKPLPFQMPISSYMNVSMQYGPCTPSSEGLGLTVLTNRPWLLDASQEVTSEKATLLEVT